MMAAEGKIFNGPESGQKSTDDTDHADTDINRVEDKGNTEQENEDISVVIEDETDSHPITSNRLVFGASDNYLRVRANAFTKIESDSFEKSGVIIPENEIEAHRICNNYKFGFKKWKSHVTSRPITARSEIVQDLYSDIDAVKSARISTFRPFNILYTIFFGWWMSLVYIIIAVFMFLTFIGRNYGIFCLKMAKYFIWPFGKFVHQVHHVPLHSVAYAYKVFEKTNSENQPLLNDSNNTTLSTSDSNGYKVTSFWKKPQSYVWLIFGIPVLWPFHAVAWFFSWFLVFTIPVAKVNSKMLTRILFLPPEEIKVENESELGLNPQKRYSEIVMYTHQAINFYYYKLTVDGVNVIFVNLLLFVVLSISIGFADEDSVIVDPVTKCILGVLAIMPLTYYVGLAITSISAQSNFAVGAILNATFGSMVEVILFIIMLKKGKDNGQECYQELVKSSLTGAILVSILFIPGISMVVGGFKYRTQNFNPKSANVSAALLFVSFAGMFSPTIFSLLYGHFNCEDCQLSKTSDPSKQDFFCKMCIQSVFGPDGDRKLYDAKVLPLVYSCVVILPLAYIVGLVFTMKTHTYEIYHVFETQLKEETGIARAHAHGAAQWSRLKSVIILLLCATSIALCGDLISNNIQPLLEKSGLSEYFIGVTMLSLVAELPEVVNGIQFALQNNVNLGIEIGSTTAIQVCLVQVPLLVLVDLIYPMGFHLIFAEVHFWAVIFSVIVINYIFQDGKSDYFQGSIVVFIYVLLMMMYMFTIPPDNAVCINATNATGNATVPP